ncbi:hypothetical protein ACF1AY_00430 [Streptomyces sp. NPDC014776]|uniref:hypothetical protein n=1 Tax=unclassified Streptomyces TaxID=2593676 RepID=UPI0036F94BD4
MAQEPRHLAGSARKPGDTEWSGVFLIGGLLALYTPLAGLCGLIAFFVRGWPTGCALLGVTAVFAALSHLASQVALRGAGLAARPAGGDGQPERAPVPRPRVTAEDGDEASPWVVVSALLFLLGCGGALTLGGGLVAFFLGGGGTAVLVLAAGAAALVAGFTPDGWLRTKRKTPARPSRRARDAARAAGLGRHLRTLRGPNPLFWLLMAPLAFVAPFALLGGISWLVGDGDTPGGKAAGGLLLISFVLVLAGPGLAGMVLWSMPGRLVRTHLYEGGLVQEVDGRVRTRVGWEEITALEGEFTRNPVARPRACVIVCADGSRVRVRADRGPVGDVGRFDAFMRRLVPEANRRRIPVHARFLTLYR